jgi:hypothetical protein
MCDAGTYVTLAEAASLLETTEMRVLMMLKNKELVGKLEDDIWQVEKVSLQLCGKPKASDLVRPGGCGGGCGGGNKGNCGGH